ncbi:hypothetical protein GCM10010347_10840 [Streptomyces cirratus]|uniref:Lipoprotein n=1 Tax=Streptomyces cirratus TaxID=68187 RepID=A0ABQ3EP22_9ACTN|nr:hypothetical protein [Streptomyces cirratus]GHB43467.1 hypothetical protein GCM10010347_10840 [Streptomyces cirratus]
MGIPADGADGSRRAGRTGTVLRRTLAALLLAGAAVACGPDTGSGAAASLAPATPSAVVSASASPSPSASSSPLPGPSASGSAPEAVRTPSAEPTTSAPAPTTKAPAPTRAATVEPTQEPTQAEEAACEIVSDAGNCYKAGQFCRKADVGRETHAANGRLIHCRSEGSRARWNY